MTLAESLLRAVLDDPGDDAPRLVYADAVEEDDPDRAEFIRVQCAAAMLSAAGHTADPWARGEPPECPVQYTTEGCEECHTLINLRKRELELLAPNWSDWSGRVATYCGNFHPDGGGAVGVTFRRGFVTAATCRLEDWAGGPCRECGGEGGRYGNPPPRVQWTWSGDCLFCEDGRTPGHGKAIVARHPVTEVRTDREPYPVQVGATVRYCWYNGVGGLKSMLPSEVFRLLRGDPSSYATLSYATEAAALAALSAALIALARVE